jgi:predicted transcriptional regulator of viral defense system
MNFDELVRLVGSLSWFDLATLVQLTSERRKTIVTQLYRWIKTGKVIALRRGMYVLGEPYRRTAPSPAYLANIIYRPSYLSGAWALSYFGMIPESVPVYTSVTTRKPRTFENAFGTFRYQNIKASLFFGYEPLIIVGAKVLVARIEKALVDFFYLSRGEWTPARMREMRFSAHMEIDRGRLLEAVEKADTPRLRRAIRIWTDEMSDAARGVTEL